jgi:hypothetical protein
MRSLAAVALLCSATTAHAESDVTLDLSAGGGADRSTTAAATTTSSFGALRAAATLELWRTSPPPPVRGLVITDRGQLARNGVAAFADRAWLFTGLDPDDRDTIGVTGEATALLDPDDTTDDTLLLASRAWARGNGWQVEGSASHQPTGDLRDAFWRSGRGVTATSLAVDVPGMWGMGGGNTRIEFARFRVAGGARTGSGFDRALDVDFAKIWAGRTEIDLVSLRLFEYGVVERTTGDVAYGTSAMGGDVMLARVTAQLPAGLQLHTRGGLVIRQPVSAFMQDGNTTLSDGPVITRPDAWAELRYGTRPGATGPRITLGGGTWTRIDPTGLAVDTGGLGTLAVAWTRGRLDARADAQLGQFQRAAVSVLAPAELAPPGTTMWMGRGALSLALRFDHDLSLSAGIWVERSDRDDPRWRTPATGAVTTHAGAELAAAWRFSR